MRKDKEKAIQLRLKGYSYRSISKELSIPKSTLASWFKDQNWSAAIRDQLSTKASFSNPNVISILVKVNKERWQQKYQEYRNIASVEFNKLKNDPLFLAGIMLYWGQGEKQQKYSVVRLSNSDPEMIKIFNQFLTKSIGISQDKIFVWLLLYPDLVDSVQKNFWSKVTGIPLNTFKKSIYMKDRKSQKRTSYGVCSINVHSRALKERMLMWLELYKDFLKSHAQNLDKSP